MSRRCQQVIGGQFPCYSSEENQVRYSGIAALVENDYHIPLSQSNYPNPKVPMLGKTLAQYEITAHLGTCGVGEDYRAMNHTNASSISGVQQRGDWRFLAMELADGEVLSSWN